MVLDWHLLSNVLDILYFLLFCTGSSLLPPSQNTSHPGIQNLSQKISHPILFGKCMCMQESISVKYK